MAPITYIIDPGKQRAQAPLRHRAIWGAHSPEIVASLD